MNLLKKTSILSIICLMLIINPLNIKADNENTISQKNEIEVTIPINHGQTPDLIKTQLLEGLAKIDKTIVLEDIDYDKTSFVIDGHVDNTKVAKTSQHVMLNIVNKANAIGLSNQTFNLDVIFNLIDITEPELVLTQEKVDVALNDIFDPWAFVEYAYDNSKVYPTVAIINNVDTSTLGEYEVIYAASDESGNRYQTSLNVNVTKYAQRVSTVEYNGDDILYMLDLINAERSNLGLEPLQLADENGQTAVAIRASEAASYLSHSRPDGSHYKTALNEQGASYANSPLEVLTYAGNTVEAKFNWWMSSTNHRAILMSGGNYHTIAIGYNGRMWCAIVY